MPSQVSRCYYHPENGSVATCSKCGIGLCSKCVRHDLQGRVVCPTCCKEEIRKANKLANQEHKEYRKALKESGGQFSSGRDFIRPGIIGMLLLIGAGLLCFLNYSEMQEEISHNIALFGIGTTIFMGVFMAYFLFSIPFCYVVIDDLFPNWYMTGDSIRFKKFIILVVSMFVGWIVFTFYWVRFIIRKIRSRKKKDNAETPTTGEK